MNRRDFVRNAAVGTLARSFASATFVSSAEATKSCRTIQHSAIPANKKANLKLGTQHGDSDDILKVLAAFGVNHICALPPALDKGGARACGGLAAKWRHNEL